MSESWVLGIEIGGTKLQLGIGQGQGSVLALERLRVDPSRGAAGIRDQIQAAFPTLLAKTNLGRRQIEAAGIGFGGPVDAPSGRTHKSFQIDGWDDFPLAAWIGEHLGVPRVVLENDADTAGLAEARFGAGIGHSPLLYMTVGSGIGGALHRRSIKSTAASARARSRSDTCGCPTIRHRKLAMLELEQVASGWAIASAAQELGRRKIQEGRDGWPVLTRAQGDPDRITAALVAEAALGGDPDSSAILDRARTAVAFALDAGDHFAGTPPNRDRRRRLSRRGKTLVRSHPPPDRPRRLSSHFGDDSTSSPPRLGEEVVVHGALAIARDAVAK